MGGVSMAEECNVCVKAEVIRRMQEDIAKSELRNDAIEKVVYEIKSSHSQTQFIMEQIQKTQDLQTLTMKEYQSAQASAMKEYQAETTRINKENQIVNARLSKEQSDKSDANFKAIEDKAIAKELKALEEKKALEVETKRIKEAKAIEDKRLKEIKDKNELEARKEKRAQNRQLVYIGLGILASIIASTAFGIIKLYFPKTIGL